ncbi:hypothetical protein CDEST_02153 [Colletotrichum destructivum]|uniref:Transposase n=1 Tax=Colletotrichum destructivum TaxID=34406 RepID=A0AAX4I258_9PEZI|nr:hypothetical protein CDEST_02153 [Colletotrichum destructivum]
MQVNRPEPFSTFHLGLSCMLFTMASPTTTWLCRRYEPTTPCLREAPRPNDPLASPTIQRQQRIDAARSSNQQQLRPVRKKAQDLSRDQRIQARSLRQYAGWSYKRISATTGFTQRQVQGACERATPQKAGSKRGRGYRIRTPHREKLGSVLVSDLWAKGRPWGDLRWIVPGLEIYGEAAITSTLKAMRFRRAARPKTLDLQPEVKALRKVICQGYLDLWSDLDSWLSRSPVFSDETWVLSESMYQQYITLSQDERAGDFSRRRQHAPDG